MADHIVIEGVRPYDGRYLFDLENQELTTREWGWIKRLAGYLPLTVEEGLSDPELIVVFAVIALHRSGKIQAREASEVFEAMVDAPFGSAIVMETEPLEDAEGKESETPGVRAKLERERRHFWARIEEFGDIAQDPRGLWHPWLGFFGVRPDEVGELTRRQLLECYDLFVGMHGGDDG